MAEAGAPLGNQNAVKGRIWAAAIKRALARKMNSTVDKGLDALADKIVAAGIDLGEQWAIKEIGDRLDGKPAQAIIGGDEDDPAVKHVHRVELVALAKRTDSAT